MDERTLARFVGKVEVQPNGCWHWTGKIQKENGYGYFWLDGKTRLAHRVSYSHFVGEIPEGYEVDHACHTWDENCPGGRCDHRKCVNPGGHLEAVTELENVMRSRGVAAANAAKTVCDRGHDLSPENTYVYPSGERGCRICRTDWWRDARDRENPDRMPPASERTHCPLNHAYDVINTYVNPKTGKRTCRTCARNSNRETARRRRASKKAAAAQS